MLRFVVLWSLTVWSGNAVRGGEQPFRVKPYLQYPTQDAISICWFSEPDQSGTVTLELPEGLPLQLTSQPMKAEDLCYNPFGEEPGAPHPAPPYRHAVRFEGLRPATWYRYRVRQGDAEFTDVLRTAPDADTPIRFMVYADSETEPESTGAAVDWPAGKGSNRPEGIQKYLVDQTAYSSVCGHRQS
jgi:hypothetical protein